MYDEEDDLVSTLEISLVDKLAGVEVVLYYTVFDNFSAICRSVKINNISDTHMYVEKVSSVRVIIPWS